jgi:hypothetical protein
LLSAKVKITKSGREKQIMKNESILKELREDTIEK